MAVDKNNQQAFAGQLGPLPLTSMERFHLHDQTARFPNTICCRLIFDGVINPEFADQATRVAVDRHPIMGSVVDCKNGKPFWSFQPKNYLPENWQEPWSENAVFDPSGGPGLQLVSRCSDSKTAFWLQVNHAVCDGVGAVSFISDWLKIYHNLHAGLEATYKLRKLNNRQLLTRDNLGLLKRKYLRHLWKQPVGLYGTAKFLFRKVAEIDGDGNGAQEMVDWDHAKQPAVLGIWLDEQSSDLLAKAAGDKGVTLNTYLLAHFYIHLAAWLRQHRPAQAKKWMRIIHPFNLRDYSHRRMPATNRVAIVQIDRCHRDLDDFDRLLRGLDQEIGVINDWELGKLFLIAIRAMSWLPGMLKRSARSEKCRGTCVFTSLSEPFGRSGLPVENRAAGQSQPAQLRIGNLLLDTFDFMGPVRHGTPINLIVLRHLGRLRFSFHYDPRILDRDTAEQFLSAYSDRLRSSNSN